MEPRPKVGLNFPIPTNNGNGNGSRRGLIAGLNSNENYNSNSLNENSGIKFLSSSPLPAGNRTSRAPALLEFKTNLGLKDGEVTGKYIPTPKGEFHSIFFIEKESEEGTYVTGIRKIAAAYKDSKKNHTVKFKSITSKQFFEDTAKEIVMYKRLYDRDRTGFNKYLLPARMTSGVVEIDDMNVAILDFDYVHGVNLRDFINSHPRYSFDNYKPVLLQIITAIQWLLSLGYIHTDINLKNFWIVYTADDTPAMRADGTIDVRILDLADITGITDIRGRETAYNWSVDKRTQDAMIGSERNGTGFIGLVEACKAPKDVISTLISLYYELRSTANITEFYTKAYNILASDSIGGRRRHTRRTKRRRTRHTRRYR